MNMPGLLQYLAEVLGARFDLLEASRWGEPIT